MAEKMKDAEDLILEAMFSSESVNDDGFSVRVEKRIRRRILIQRFTLPIAVLLGGAIAVKPLIVLLTTMMQMFVISPEGVSSYLGNLASNSAPSITLVSLGVLSVFAFIMVGRILEE